MSTPQMSQLAEIEASIARNKEIVAKGNALERLKNSADFKKVIGEGYLKDEAVRLVLLKGDHNMAKPDRQAFIQAEIDAIGHFHAYLNSVAQFAAMAASSIEDAEAAREEIAAEELGQ